jgi:hypothetical protein
MIKYLLMAITLRAVRTWLVNIIDQGWTGAAPPLIMDGYGVIRSRTATGSSDAH